MQAISLWNPWAEAMRRKLKTIETRHWQPPERLIGQRIAIHAAKRKIKDKEWSEFIDDPNWKWAVDGFSDMAYGKIVLTGILHSVVKTTHPELIEIAKASNQLMYGNYEPKRFGWIFSDIVVLHTPVPFKASQGFFNVPDELIGLKI